MAANVHAHPDRDGPVLSTRSSPAFVAIALAVVSGLSWLGSEGEILWSPAVGVGLACCWWIGVRFAGLLTITLFVLLGIAAIVPATSAHVSATSFALAGLLGVQLAAGWWLYFRIAEGSPRFDDPRSAVLFLIVIIGLAAVVGAVARVALLLAFGDWTGQSPDPIHLYGIGWIANMIGYLALAPVCLAVLTPVLQSLGFLRIPRGVMLRQRALSWGEGIELSGLAFGNALLGAIQVRVHLDVGNDAWPLWGISLLLVVWSSLRQGVRGGAVTSFAGTTAALILARQLNVGPSELSPLQGNFLAQCAVSLLVGSSMAWIRATEARYRQVVGHIPLVLSSVRLHEPIAVSATSKESPGETHRDSRPSAMILREAEVVLVSRASETILGVPPDELIGPFSLWLEMVLPEDRDIVIASLAQLALQRETITCEYRVMVNDPAIRGVSDELPNEGANGPATTPAATPRWIRDTIAPHYTDDGRLDGWDGVLEEITQQRLLQHENRRIAGMLQALVANMPTGVFFVQGPGGQPILVNARARQLLGQREDMSAGLVHLSHVYRLHRQDGSEYPVDDLPVAKALRYGQTCTANDIVVHRPDGRRVPLFTWAAPIDLGKVGRPEAAVWVLEDLSALKQAEFARRETEARLRAVFETLAEGVIVQNKAGVIIEGNPTAAQVLGLTIDQLVGRSWLGPDRGCLRDDGSPFPVDQHPDRLALQIKMPVRNVVLGLPRGGGEVRWVMVNSMPLPVGTAFAPNSAGAQLVTTFADITHERQAQRILLAAKEKYQTLVDTLPVIILRLILDGSVVYGNPAAREFFGAAAGDLTTPGAFESLFDAVDQPRVRIAIQQAASGKESRFEFGVVSRTGEAKIGLAFVNPQWHNGVVIGSAWIVVDMTRQRRLEEELVKSQRLELVGRLASGTVHDFNNLMTSVIGTAGILKLEVHGNSDWVENLDLIERNATQATRLVSQILSLGRNPNRPTRVLDLNDAVLAAVSMVKNVLPANISLKVQLSDEPLSVEGDELQLKQVVLNLCLNARDAMPGGGVLAITTRSDNRHGHDWAVIAIDDTGHGMSESVREKMFEPFFTTKEQGAGIGLTVVREIVQQMHGTLDCFSEPSKGAHFEIGIRIWRPTKNDAPDESRRSGFPV